jgi:flagellum-specific peptidoglycan hydrolase FlgJ
MSAPPPEFVAAAQAAQRKWGLPALTSLALAQCKLESNYGAHMAGESCNPLGIMARLNNHNIPIDPYVCTKTGEGGTAGKPTSFRIAPLRKYATFTEALDAHGKLLATGSPYAGARKLLPDIAAYVREMARHYATATDYGPRLLSIMKADNLYRFDVHV